MSTNQESLPEDHLEMKATDKPAEKLAFQALRRQMAAGEATALARLQRHVQRRVKSGWAPTTIAKRLGLTLADVARLAKVRHAFNDSPRLRRTK